MIGRLVAMAPRVAKVTDSTVTTSTSSRMAKPAAAAVPAMARMRSIQRRWSSSVASGTCVARALRKAAKSGDAPDTILTTINRGIGRSSSTSPVPSHGSISLADSSLV